LCFCFSSSCLFSNVASPFYIVPSVFSNVYLYTDKFQRNEQIKQYAIYTSTVNRLMELTGRTDYLYLYI
jgi:hypothetical protein